MIANVGSCVRHTVEYLPCRLSTIMILKYVTVAVFGESHDILGVLG